MSGKKCKDKVDQWVKEELILEWGALGEGEGEAGVPGDRGCSPPL